MASLVLDQYLRCPVCMDFFADPHRLPCSHCFCKRCLEGVRQHCLSFNCPECRQLVVLDYRGIDGLEKDRRLAAMVDEFAHQQQQSRVCKEHKRTVEGYCETCAVLMCGRCFFSDQHSGHTMGDVDVVAKKKRVLHANSFYVVTYMCSIKSYVYTEHLLIIGVSSNFKVRMGVGMYGNPKKCFKPHMSCLSLELQKKKRTKKRKGEA